MSAIKASLTPHKHDFINLCPTFLYSCGISKNTGKQSRQGSLRMSDLRTEPRLSSVDPIIQEPPPPPSPRATTLPRADRLRGGGGEINTIGLMEIFYLFVFQIWEIDGQSQCIVSYMYIRTDMYTLVWLRRSDIAKIYQNNIELKCIPFLHLRWGITTKLGNWNVMKVTNQCGRFLPGFQVPTINPSRDLALSWQQSMESMELCAVFMRQASRSIRCSCESPPSCWVLLYRYIKHKITMLPAIETRNSFMTQIFTFCM